MPTIIDKTTIDPNLRFEHPKRPRISSPAITAALAVAAEAGQRAADAAAEENTARNDALHLSTRIEALRATREQRAVRLRALEAHDVAKYRATCTASVEKYLDVPGMDARDSNELNTAVVALAGLREVEKLLPKITASVKGEISEIDRQLAALEGSK